MVIDPMGNAFVADTGNNTIRRIALATGAVSTIAGSPGVSGSTDGAGSVARFNAPWGLAIDSSGGFSTIYIADEGNNVIRALNVSSNTVSTIAGTAGMTGSADGTGAAARFNGPRAVATDGYNVWVADSMNNTIRQIVLGTGVVTTLAGSASAAQATVDGTGSAARFRLPTNMALDGVGNMFINDVNSQAVRKMVLGTNVVTTLAIGGSIAGSGGLTNYNGTLYMTSDDSAGGALLSVNITTGAVAKVMTIPSVGAIAFDSSGNGFVSGDNEIDKLDLTAKTVTTVAGAMAHFDSNETGQLLAFPNVIAGNGADLLFVNQGTNYVVEQISVSTGMLSYITNASCLGSFTGLANVKSGTLTAACASSNTIVNLGLPPAGGETTVAGSDFVAGSSDGTGSAALFNNPTGMCDDGAGTVYLADTGNHVIRQIVVSSGVVTTLAGMAGTAGSADGTGLAASFNGPASVACDHMGNVYVGDNGNHTVRRIVIATKKVTTIAGTAGVTGSTDGAGTAALFGGPTSLAADAAGNLFVSDGNTVRFIGISGSNTNVTTLIGIPGHVGVLLGALPAGLNHPAGMIVLPSGALAITDPSENAVLVAQ
jgi:hypothetical protein